MGIPAQIEEAAQLAEEVHESLFKENHTEEEANEQEVEAEAGEETETKAKEEVEQEEVVDQEEEKYEARYKSLKGKYDKEVPRLQSELKQLKEEIFDRIGEAKKEVKEEEIEKAPASDETLEKFKEEYGEDLLEMVKHLIHTETDPRLEEALKPVQEKVESTEKKQLEDARKEFTEFLNKEVKGDWEAAWNEEDPKFQEFLAQPDPSGLYTYGELVNLYVNNWEAEKLSKVFNSYFSDNQPKAKPKNNPKQDAVVAPARDTQHVVPESDDKIIWTNETIEDFKRKDRMGKYDAEESQALWNDLLLAVNEGRIR